MKTSEQFLQLTRREEENAQANLDTASPEAMTEFSNRLLVNQSALLVANKFGEPLDNLLKKQ